MILYKQVMVNSVRQHGRWAEDLQCGKIIPYCHSQQQQFSATEISVHKENIFVSFILY